MAGRGKTAAPIAPSAFRTGKRSPRQAANSELHIAIVKAATRLMDEFSAIVKPVDLSLSQYNVLRILRGAGPEGATCGQVVERLIQRDPDVTRLLDRLERRGLIERNRDSNDRRIVRTCITEAGLELLASLDDAVNLMHARHLGHLSDQQLGDLRRLIEEVTT
jgi:DNA-binding MarR family transcriptional regulator